MNEQNKIVADANMRQALAQPQQNEVVSNFADAMRIGKVFASSSIVPQQYANKIGDCAIAVDMAQRMGVSPLMVMQQLYVVKGKPSHGACLLVPEMARETQEKQRL